MKVEINDQKALNSPDEVASVVEGLRDYELEVAGVGKPRLAPLLINCDKPYHVAVTCIVHSTPRSTSDLHGRPGDKLKAIPYGRSLR